jgi:hypothetical protein
MKNCPQCNIEKKIEEFSKNKNTKDGLQRICKLCIAVQSKKSYNKDSSKYKERVKIQVDKCISFIDNYKSTHSCNKCSENRNWVLDFHHIDKKEKEYNIGDLKYSGSLNKIKTEISKCVLLCKNCHYDFHHLERTLNISIKDYLNKN